MSVDSVSQYTYDLSTGPGIGLQGALHDPTPGTAASFSPALMVEFYLISFNHNVGLVLLTPGCSPVRVSLLGAA